MSFGGMLIDTVTIEMPAGSKVEGHIKGYKVTYSNRATDAKVRIEPLSGHTASTVLGRFETATHRMFLEGSQAIEVNDRITDADGVKYRVVNIGNYFSHHKEVIMELLK